MVIYRKVAGVPESLLKKQKATEALAAKRAEERVALKKVILCHVYISLRMLAYQDTGLAREALHYLPPPLYISHLLVEGNDDQKTKGLITEANFGWPYDWSIGVSELYHEHRFSNAWRTSPVAFVPDIDMAL